MVAGHNSTDSTPTSAAPAGATHTSDVGLPSTDHSNAVSAAAVGAPEDRHGTIPPRPTAPGSSPAAAVGDEARRSTTQSGMRSGTADQREHDPDHHLDVDAFLQQQTELAGKALRQSVEDVRKALARAADPRIWIEEYPVAGTAAALVAGVAAGRYLTSPSRPVPQPAAAPAAPPAGQPQAGGLSPLLQQLVHNAAQALITLVAARMAAKPEGQEEPVAHSPENGCPAGTSQPARETVQAVG